MTSQIIIILIILGAKRCPRLSPTTTPLDPPRNYIRHLCLTLFSLMIEICLNNNVCYGADRRLVSSKNGSVFHFLCFLREKQTTQQTNMKSEVVSCQTPRMLSSYFRFLLKVGEIILKYIFSDFSGRSIVAHRD